MLTLNANLISVSAMNNMGFTTTSRNGKGITCKADGTVVLSGEKISGMYSLETIDNPQNPTIAMTSLSKLTFLKQWHH
jgi:hypothetical protein